MSLVVGVSGPTGAGKTALAEALLAELGDAQAIYMDDYERMTREPLDQVARWAERGADFDQLPLPGLAEDLRRLKKQGAARYVVFETQFGRAHRATGELIDFSIWIDVPLEVALARKVKAFTAAALGEEPARARERLQWLDGYVAGYLGLVRRLLLVQAEKVRPRADLVVDGSADPAALARLAGRELRRRLERA